LTTIAILQARSSSSRLPGKVLLPVHGVPMLSRQIDRIGRAKSLDRIVVATSTAADDDAIEILCGDMNIDCFRGALDDVLDRVDCCAAAFDADHVVRLTGDCPLADPGVIDRVVRAHTDGKSDYTSNVHPPTWPDGLDVEIMRRDVLAIAAAEARLPSEREHVTPFIVTRGDRFALSNVETAPDRSDLRLTVDEPRDFELVARIYEALLPEKPDFDIDDVLALLDGNPQMLGINAGIDRNEGAEHSRRQDAKILAEGKPRNAQ
jgi:spore coat polysaccharide biosynthesis protein SpsF